MKRRNFLKSAGAAALLPVLPIPSTATAMAATPVSLSTPALSNHMYQWAKMIVRAHNKCNLGLLQRSLQVDATLAATLKEKLIHDGVVSMQANAYGIHTATKPLYEGAFINVSETARKTGETIKKARELVEDISGSKTKDGDPISENAKSDTDITLKSQGSQDTLKKTEPDHTVSVVL